MVLAMEALARLKQFVIEPAMMVVFAAGFFLFLFGFLRFFWDLSQGGEGNEGKSHMLWGVVGMFIMVAWFGILSIVVNTLDLGDPTQPDESRMNNVPAFNLR